VPSAWDPDPPENSTDEADTIEGSWFWRTGLQGSAKRWQFEENERSANDAKTILTVSFASSDTRKTVTRYRPCAELLVYRNDTGGARCGAEVHFKGLRGIPNEVIEAARVPASSTDRVKVCSSTWGTGPLTLQEVAAGQNNARILVQPDEAFSPSAQHCTGNYELTPDFEFEVTEAYLEYEYTEPPGPGCP
jgi:hypothetical protein